VIVTGSILSCAGKTPVYVINYDDKEFYEVERDGDKFSCMSDYYLKEILQAKISKIKP